MDRMLKVGVAALVLAAGSAFGQETAQPAQATEAKSAVQRPEIKPSSSPYWVWSDYISGLKVIREGAPSNLTVNEEQEKTIREVSREFRTKYAEFMRTNRAELVELRAKLGENNTNADQAEEQLVEAGAGGAVPPKQMEREIDLAEQTVPALKQGTPEWDAAIKRFREILRSAPDAAEYKARVDKLLTEEQRAAVKTRTELAYKNRQAKAVQQAEAIKKLEGIVAAYDINNPAIPEHIRERWAKVDTATKFKMMRGIEQRLRTNGGTWDKDGVTPRSQATAPEAQPAQSSDPR
jgi:signal recognition particle subunit SEC65